MRIVLSLLRAAVMLFCVGFILMFFLAALSFGQGAPLPSVQNQFFGATGIAAPLGFVCTTTSGTSTPLATYREVALTNANQNPIRLNAAGRPAFSGAEVSVFLQAAAYRITVYAAGTGATCNGVTVGAVLRTADGISGPNLYLADFNPLIVDNVIHCAQSAGANAGAKIAACITALPSTGGTADARGLEGAQTWSSCPVTGVTKPVSLLIGASTHTISVNCTSPANVSYELSAGAILSPNTGTTFTFNGNVDGSLTTHFAGAGSVLLNGNLRLYPQWWGANGTDATDDAAAFQAAMVVANNSGYSSVFGGVGAIGYTKPILSVPVGLYRISADISNGQTLGGGIVIDGSDATFEVSAGVTFMSGINGGITVKDIAVRGGAIAFASTSNNVDTTYNFNNVQLYQQTDVSILSEILSASWVFSGCRFQNYTTTGGILRATGGTIAYFTDTWGTVSATAKTAFDMDDSGLVLTNFVGVGNGLHSWVTLRDGSFGFVTVINSRMAFDGGGGAAGTFINYAVATNIQNTGVPNGWTIRDSAVYGAGPVLYMYAIPSRVDITGLTGLTNSTPVVVDAGVTAGNLATIGEFSHTYIYRVEYNSLNYTRLINSAAPSAARDGLPLIGDRPLLTARPNATSFEYQSQADTGTYGPQAAVVTNVTVGTGNDEFGVPYLGFTATANDASAQKSYTSALSGLAAGVYTAVFDMEITTEGTMQIYFQVSNVTSQTNVLTRGSHSLAVPFYYDGGASQSVVVMARHMPNTSVLRWTRWKIFKGRMAVAGKSLEMDGTAAPTAKQFYRGDRVWNTNKASFNTPAYWTNVVSGTPGAWAANSKAGVFTMTAANSLVISEPEWKTDGVTYVSVVALQPTNAAAAALMAGAKTLYVGAGVNGVSFTVTTADGTSAAGTETFIYSLIN